MPIPWPPLSVFRLHKHFFFDGFKNGTVRFLTNERLTAFRCQYQGHENRKGACLGGQRGVGVRHHGDPTREGDYQLLKARRLRKCGGFWCAMCVEPGFTYFWVRVPASSGTVQTPYPGARLREVPYTDLRVSTPRCLVRSSLFLCRALYEHVQVVFGSKM